MKKDLSSSNKATIIGTLTCDPELSLTQEISSEAILEVSVTKRVTTSGTSQERTSYFDVRCHRELATNVCESLKSGDRVLVSGCLEQRFVKSTNGKEIPKLEIVADEVSPSLRDTKVVVNPSIDNENNRSTDI